MIIAEIINEVDFVEVEIQNEIVKVFQSIPISRKIRLIDTMMRRIQVDSIPNPFKIEAIFYTYFVLKYTDIKVDSIARLANEKELYELYDYFKLNGFIEMVINNLPENEYQEFFEAFNITLERAITYSNSVSGAISGIAAALPEVQELVSKATEEIGEKGVLDLSKIRQEMKDD